MRKPRHRVTKRQAVVVEAPVMVQPKRTKATPAPAPARASKCGYGCEDVIGKGVSVLCDRHYRDGLKAEAGVRAILKGELTVDTEWRPADELIIRPGVELPAADSPHQLHPYAGGQRKVKAARMGDMRRSSKRKAA